MLRRSVEMLPSGFGPRFACGLGRMDFADGRLEDGVTGLISIPSWTPFSPWGSNFLVPFPSSRKRRRLAFRMVRPGNHPVPKLITAMNLQPCGSRGGTRTDRTMYRRQFGRAQASKLTGRGRQVTLEGTLSRDRPLSTTQRR